MVSSAPQPGGLSAPAASGLVLVSIVSVQLGGALAATLLPRAGVAGSVGLRLGLSAAVLLAVVRPSWRRSRADWVTVAAYAAALTGMNVTFYAALTRLPLGVAVTLELTGPLVLTAVTGRRARDLLAVATAGAGVLLVSGALGADWRALDLTGCVLALTAGACWAAYILAGARTGARFAGLDGLAVALTLGALVVLPVGLAVAGPALADPGILTRGAGIAVLSSLIPYGLELVALRVLPASLFGILLSLEPAAAALAGLVVLGQRLSPAQCAGAALVVAAAVLVLGSRSRVGPPRD